MNTLTDRELTQLQETGSVLLPRHAYRLAALLAAVEELGIDPLLVSVAGAGAALWLRIQDDAS